MRPHLITLAALALLAGCGADTSVSPNTTPVTLDQVFKEMSLSSISGATSAAAGLDASAFSPGSTAPAGCTYALASQSFACAPVTAGGMTFTQSYQLLNASGSPLSAFDAASLSAVRMQSTISGTDTTDGDTFTLNGHMDQTLSGLRTSKHVLNGATTLNLVGSFSGGTTGTAPVTMTLTSTTKDLVIPANAGSKTYPASGTITIDEAMSISGLPSFSTRIVLTFDGTSKVKITIDGAAVSGCSTIDLSAATPGCS